MFKSIRWTLLFWYGLILSVVIAGFGATLYHDLDRQVRGRSDARLHDALRSVVGGLMGPRHGRADEFRLPDRGAQRFRGSEPDTPYYAVWDAEGKMIACSRPGLGIPRPVLGRVPWPTAEGPHLGPPRGGPPPGSPRGGPPPAPSRGGHERGGGFGGPPQARDRGPWRELAARGPRGTTVLVGQSREEEARRLREFLGMVFAAGLGTLAVALVGGWFVAGRALAPIERMSAVASEVSASNLSRRIDVEKTESELGRLATILNVAFDRLEAAFRRQVQFTADASHELRTPLSIVISHAELALRKERTAADYRAAIETCLRAARRMESVVDGLLTLARADAGESGLRRERVDLGGLVSESVELLEALAEPRRVAIGVDAAPAVVEGDPDRLREMIANLLANAILYNRPGGSVSIGLRVEGGRASLRVADTGIGIPEADLPYVFERFYRVEEARSREQGGNGLGLSIAKWVADAHGGSIGVASREGVGTTFLVDLPAAVG